MDTALIVLWWFLGTCTILIVAFAIMWIGCEISWRQMAKKHKLYKEAMNLVYMHDMIRIVKREPLPAPNNDKNFSWYNFYLKSYDEIKKPKTMMDIWRQSEEYEEVAAYVNKNKKVWDEEVEECYKLSVG